MLRRCYLDYAMKKDPLASFSTRYAAARGVEAQVDSVPKSHCSEWNYTNGSANLGVREALWRHLGSPHTSRARARRAAVPNARNIVRKPLLSIR